MWVRILLLPQFFNNKKENKMETKIKEAILDTLKILGKISDPVEKQHVANTIASLCGALLTLAETAKRKKESGIKID